VNPAGAGTCSCRSKPPESPVIWITSFWGRWAPPWTHGDETIYQIRYGPARRSDGNARARRDALPSNNALHEMLHSRVPDDGDDSEGRRLDRRGNHRACLLRGNVSSSISGHRTAGDREPVRFGGAAQPTPNCIRRAYKEPRIDATTHGSALDHAISRCPLHFSDLTFFSPRGVIGLSFRNSDLCWYALPAPK
jgi:hypothetical protein